MYTCLRLGHCYKQIWYFTPLFSSVVVSLGFGLVIRMFFWWRGGPTLFFSLFFFTLCCRRALCGCCCRCAPWFQSYPAWETLCHFLPSAVASCRGREEKQEVRGREVLGGMCFFPAGWWQEHIQLMWTGTDWSVTTQRMFFVWSRHIQ